MNGKKHSLLFGVGGVTLLTVLLVLILTMFAVLTLSSAQADMRLSEKNARAVSGYYVADSQAALLQARAAALWPADQPRPESVEAANALSADYDVTVSEQGRGLMFFCGIPINNAGQVLRLALYLAPPENDIRWRVEQWQFVPPSPLTWDEPSLPVWIGD